MLHLVRFYPAWDAPLNDMHSVVATIYRFVIGAGGAWLTARLAPTHPIKHVLWLGVLGTVIGMLGVAMTWHRAMGPHWYGIAVAALAIPQSWAGGRFYLSRHGDE